MTWHYAAGYKMVDGEREYGVHEVYEGLNEDGTPAYTADPVAPCGETQGELINDLFRMAKDVMYHDEFEVKENTDAQIAEAQEDGP